MSGKFESHRSQKLDYILLQSCGFGFIKSSKTEIYKLFVDHFALLDPDPDFESGSGYGSTTLELSQLIIDAIALLLEFKGFLFGFSLSPSDRDRITNLLCGLLLLIDAIFSEFRFSRS